MGVSFACGRDHGSHHWMDHLGFSRATGSLGHGLSTGVGGLFFGGTWKILQPSSSAARREERLRRFRWFNSNLEETVGLDSRVTVWSRVLLRLEFVSFLLFQLQSCVGLLAAPLSSACQAPCPLLISHGLLRLMSRGQ